MKKSKAKEALARHSKTLTIDDFFEFLKEAGVLYITSATVYFEDGIELKFSLSKENLKLKELKTKWKAKK